jgi:hypothetical protein
MAMNKSFVIAALFSCLLIAAGGCSNVCQEPHSVNFNQTGACIDVTGGVIGTYSGTLRDSSGSTGTSYTIQLKITKIDNGDVSVRLLSPQTAPFTGFSAAVASSQYGYSLEVNSSDSTIKGAAAAYGSMYDGIYVSSGKQLYLYAETNPRTNPVFEAFVGTKQ